MQLKILATTGIWDIEIIFTEEDMPNGPQDVAGLIMAMTESAPEIKPRPKFQGKNNIALPFNGVIDKTELMPAKDGKKEYCLAYVKNDAGETVEVRYFPPLKTWRAGEKVKVQKGQYGPELKEIEEDGPPF